MQKHYEVTDRKPSPTELEALAWVFAHSNLGFGDPVVKNGKVEFTGGPMHSYRTLAELSTACQRYMASVAEGDGMWRGMEREQEAWCKDLGPKTFRAIAKQNPDLIEVFKLIQGA